MRIDRRVLVVALLLTSHAAFAQPRPKRAAKAAKADKGRAVEEQLKELSTKVDEASKAAADSAAAVKVLQDLQNQVSALRQEAERQQTALRGYQETRSKVQEYENRIGDMDLKLASMKVQMAGKGEVAGYDGGFFVQSPNRRFVLRLNGLLQATYEAQILDGTVYGGTTTDSSSTYRLRRATVELGGHLFLPMLGYHLTLDFGSVDPGILLEGYGEVLPHRLIKLRVGKQKIPLGRQFLTHSSRQQFVDRGPVSDTFVPGWDLGAMLYGDVAVYGQISYQLGMFNGAGAGAATNDNIDFLYAARVLYEPLGPMVDGEGDLEVTPCRPKIAIGGSFAYSLAQTDLALRRGVTDPTKAKTLNDVDRDNKIDNVGVYTVGVELAARIKGASLQSELLYRYEDPGAAADTRTFWGVYAQAGYLAFRRPLPLEIAARYGYWKPHFYGLERKTARPESIHELGVVVNIFAWQRLVKGQLEYVHQWQQNLQSVDATGAMTTGVDVKVNQVRLQLQLAF